MEQTKTGLNNEVEQTKEMINEMINERQTYSNRILLIDSMARPERFELPAF